MMKAGSGMPARAVTMQVGGVSDSMGERRPRSTSLMDQISDLSKEKFSGRADETNNHMLLQIRAAGTAWSNIKISKRETLHQLFTRMYHALPNLSHTHQTAAFALQLQTQQTADIAAAIEHAKNDYERMTKLKDEADEDEADGEERDAASNDPPIRQRSNSEVTKQEELRSTVARLEFLTEKLFAVTLLVDRDVPGGRVPFVCSCKPKPSPTDRYASPMAGRAPTIVVDVGMRVQFARGKKSLETECLIGYVRKVDAHQVLIQLNKNEDPNSDEIPPSFWVRTDSGNIRIFPEAKSQFGGAQFAALTGGGNKKEAEPTPLVTSVVALPRNTNELPSVLPPPVADEKCECIILYYRSFFSQRGPDALFKLVTSVALMIAVAEAEEARPGEAAAAAAAAAASKSSLMKAAKVLGLPSNATGDKAAKMLGLKVGGSAQNLHSITSPKRSSNAVSAFPASPPDAGDAPIASTISAPIITPAPAAALPTPLPNIISKKLKPNRAMTTAAPTTPKALLSPANSAAAAKGRSGGVISVNMNMLPGGGGAPGNAIPGFGGVVSPSFVAATASTIRTKLWCLVQEWTLKCAFQCEWLLVHQSDKMKACGGDLNASTASSRPTYDAADGAPPEPKEQWWQRDLLEKTTAFFIAHTSITPTLMACLFQSLVHKLVMPKARKLKRDAEFPGVCVIAHPWVLRSLFLALTYCDSSITKTGLEQLTALVLMHGGNASIISQQPQWIKWFAALCSGGPSDSLQLAVSMRSNASHRTPVWQPADKAEILKLCVNLIVSIFYHRFCHPPEPELVKQDKASALLGLIDEKKTGAGSNGQRASAMRSATQPHARTRTNFAEFVLGAFDDLEDALGWNWSTVNLQRVILMAFLAILGNRAHVLKSDFEHKSWPSVFELMQVLENFIFYSPVLPEHTPPPPAANSSVTSTAVPPAGAAGSTGAAGTSRPREKRRFEQFGVHIDSTNTAADIPLVLKSLILLDAINLKGFRSDALVEAADRRALALKQKKLEDETAFLVDVNEYLNLLPKKAHMQKGQKRTQSLLGGMAERLQRRKAERNPDADSDGSFLGRIGLTGWARSRRVKSIKKKLASAEISHTTDQAIVGLSTFNAAVQVKSARRVFGSEEKARAYFHSRRRAIVGEHKATLVSPLLVPKYDEAEDKESKANVEIDSAAPAGAVDASNVDFFRTIVGRGRGFEIHEAPSRLTPVAVNSIISRRFNSAASAALNNGSGVDEKHSSDFFTPPAATDSTGSTPVGSMTEEELRRARDKALGNTTRGSVSLSQFEFRPKRSNLSTLNGSTPLESVTTSDAGFQEMALPAGGESVVSTAHNSVDFGADLKHTASAPATPTAAGGTPTEMTPPGTAPATRQGSLESTTSVVSRVPSILPPAPAPPAQSPPAQVQPPLPTEDAGSNTASPNRSPAGSATSPTNPAAGAKPKPVLPPPPMSFVGRSNMVPVGGNKLPAPPVPPTRTATVTPASNPAPNAAAAAGGIKRPPLPAQPPVPATPNRAPTTQQTATATSAPAASAKPAAVAPAETKARSVTFSDAKVAPPIPATVPIFDGSELDMAVVDADPEDEPEVKVPSSGAGDTGGGEDEALSCTRCKLKWSVEAGFCEHNSMPYCDNCYLEVARACCNCSLPFKEKEAFISIAEPPKPEPSRRTTNQRKATAADDESEPPLLLYHLRCFKCYHCDSSIDVNTNSGSGSTPLPLPPTPSPRSRSSSAAAGESPTSSGSSAVKAQRATRGHARAESRAVVNVSGMSDISSNVRAAVYSHGSHIYCKKDYLELFAKRCAECTKPIESQYMSALDQSYHFECFHCNGPCARVIRDGAFYPLSARQRRIMITQANGGTLPAAAARAAKLNPDATAGDDEELKKDPYCEACYTDLFIPKCVICSRGINSAAETGVCMDSFNFHISCARCAEPECKATAASHELTPAPAPEAGAVPIASAAAAAAAAAAASPAKAAPPKLYCETHYMDRFAERCDTCLKPCTGSVMKLDASTFHETCFACSVCKTSLIDGEVFSAPAPATAAAAATAATSAIRLQLFCRTHYLATKSAARTLPQCRVCSEPITDQYVTLSGGRIVHFECLTCQCCGDTLHTAVDRSLADPDLDGPSAPYEPSEAQTKSGPLPLSARPPSTHAAHTSALATASKQIQTGIYCKKDMLAMFYRRCPMCDRYLVSGLSAEFAGTTYHDTCINTCASSGCHTKSGLRKDGNTWKLLCATHAPPVPVTRAVSLATATAPPSRAPPPPPPFVKSVSGSAAPPAPTKAPPPKPVAASPAAAVKAAPALPPPPVVKK